MIEADSWPSIRDLIWAKLDEVPPLLDSAKEGGPSSSDSSDETDWLRPPVDAIWRIGDDIRRLIAFRPALRKDSEIQQAVLGVIRDGRAGRGRQSFVMLLESRVCSELGGDLSSFLADPDISGHVANALYKMRAPGYSRLMAPLDSDGVENWVRKAAKRYIAWDADRS